MGSEGSSISNAQETNVKKEGKEKAERSRIPRVAIEDITDLDVHGPVGTNQHAARGTFHQRARHRREHGTLTRWDPSGEVRSDSRESHGRWSSSAGDRSWRVGEEREPLMEEKRVRPTRFRLTRGLLGTELEIGRMGGDPELGLGGRLLEWWSSDREEILQLGSAADLCTKVGSGTGAFIVSAVDHSYLITLLLLWPTISSYPSATLAILAVGHVGGPAVRGYDDVAARSAFVISFF
ncbi:hypothetical protein GW17_00002745, partial [Ensete ventricosum]